MKTAKPHQTKQPDGDRLVDSDIVGEGWTPVEPGADNPLWVCVTTEDGFQAWSSPIYAFR